MEMWTNELNFNEIIPHCHILKVQFQKTHNINICCLNVSKQLGTFHVDIY